jgi:hypothetical protein
MCNFSPAVRRNWRVFLGGLFASSESRKAALATSVCVCVWRSIDAFVCMEDRSGDEESIDSIRGDGRTDENFL